jgi:hypothetical protein
MNWRCGLLLAAINVVIALNDSIACGFDCSVGLNPVVRLPPLETRSSRIAINPTQPAASK